MPAKRIKTVRIDKGRYRTFWKRAVELREEVRQGMASERWNAAALNAIHAGICANDALLVYLHGQRSKSPKHEDAVKLLVELVKQAAAETNSRHLQRLMGMKNAVEYEDRLFTGAEAAVLTKHMERFLEWVESLLL